MHTKFRSLSLAIGAIAIAAASTSATPALADNTWISGPSLSHVAIVAPASVASATGFTLSTQTSTFTLTYRSSAAEGGKFAQVNFFDFSAGLDLALAASPTASSTGCAQQVLGGNTHSCMFKLDANGSADITASLSGSTGASAFKYLLLSGPNIAQTAPANVSFAVASTTLKALTPSIKALRGGAAVLQFRFLDGTLAAPSVRASVVLKGVGDHISATSVTSDANGLVWIYVANLKKKLGTSTVTLTIEGATTTAKSSIKWVKGTLGN